MIDESVRQAAMQDGFDRRCRRACAQHVSTEFIHHLRIGKLRQFRQLQYMVKAHRRETGCFDGFEVPTAAFDVQNGLGFTEKVFLLYLH